MVFAQIICHLCELRSLLVLPKRPNTKKSIAAKLPIHVHMCVCGFLHHLFMKLNELLLMALWLWPCAEPTVARLGVDYGLYRLVTAYREHGHRKANVDVLQLKQTVSVASFSNCAIN